MALLGRDLKDHLVSTPDFCDGEPGSSGSTDLGDRSAAQWHHSQMLEIQIPVMPEIQTPMASLSWVMDIQTVEASQSQVMETQTPLPFQSHATHHPYLSPANRK